MTIGDKGVNSLKIKLLWQKETKKNGNNVNKEYPIIRRAKKLNKKFTEEIRSFLGKL